MSSPHFQGSFHICSAKAECPIPNSGFFQAAQPILVKILAYEFYVIRGPENVKSLFEKSGLARLFHLSSFAFGNAFGSSAKALSLYDKDDSGGGRGPYTGSTVEARNRIDYRVHECMSTFLESKGLLPFWDRFVGGITQQLHGLWESIGPDGEDRADLMRCVRDETTVSLINVICGPHLLRLSPNFLLDFWNIDRNLQTYV